MQEHHDDNSLADAIASHTSTRADSGCSHNRQRQIRKSKNPYQSIAANKKKLNRYFDHTIFPRSGWNLKDGRVDWQARTLETQQLLITILCRNVSQSDGQKHALHACIPSHSQPTHQLKKFNTFLTMASVHVLIALNKPSKSLPSDSQLMTRKAKKKIKMKHPKTAKFIFMADANASVLSMNNYYVTEHTHHWRQPQANISLSQAASNLSETSITPGQPFANG